MSKTFVLYWTDGTKTTAIGEDLAEAILNEGIPMEKVASLSAHQEICKEKNLLPYMYEPDNLRWVIEK